MTTWPHFSQDEIDAATRVLQSGKVNYWTGDECKQFEKEFADFIGVKHAIALMNGTVALELALYALGLGVGDDVIVPCRTFIASASAVVARGARPIMADVDLESQNITVETIQAVMTPNTKAIICVHLAGWPCDMPAIMQFAKENNLCVIEDCAQAHGAKINGQYVGSFGDMAAFSFCQDKIMTTGGEGGMLLINDEDLWKKAWAYKDHGKNYDTVSQAHPPGFRWLHEDFGTNWRMTQMQAAIGRCQLQKLASWIKKRRQFASMYQDAFKNMPLLRLTIAPDSVEHAYYKYYVFVQPEKLKSDWSRDRMVQVLNEQGVPCFVGSCSEIYLEKAFKKKEFMPRQRLENARQLGETSLMFLVHPTLSELDVKKMISNIIKVIVQATDL